MRKSHVAQHVIDCGPTPRSQFHALNIQRQYSLLERRPTTPPLNIQPIGVCDAKTGFLSHRDNFVQSKGFLTKIYKGPQNHPSIKKNNQEVVEWIDNDGPHKVEQSRSNEKEKWEIPWSCSQAQCLYMARQVGAVMKQECFYTSARSDAKNG